jgi:hypothetical protein
VQPRRSSASRRVGGTFVGEISLALAPGWAPEVPTDLATADEVSEHTADALAAESPDRPWNPVGVNDHMWARITAASAVVR